MQNIKLTTISIKKTAEMLSVSAATLRNWQKHGYLSFCPGTKLFDLENVLTLKLELESGRLKRLDKRANKKKSKTTFLPIEYLQDKQDYEKIIAIIEKIKLSGIAPEECLFVLSINLLLQHKLICKGSLKEILQTAGIKKRDHFIFRDLISWRKSLGVLSLKSESFLEIELPVCDDLLGVIYQSVFQEGEKSSRGSYYTPPEVVAQIADSFLNKEKNLKMKILDPCCGTGQFLLKSVDKLKKIGEVNPENIWGFDIDIVAVRIARLNLFLKFQYIKNYRPNVYCLNFLTGVINAEYNQEFNFLEIPLFDLIITNPPWGADFNLESKKILKEKFPDIFSGESFSYFLKNSLNFLAENGSLSFILPESIMNVKVHKDIREYILKNVHVQYIESYERIFKKVFSKVIRLDLKKENREKVNKCKIEIVKGSDSYQIPQSRFYHNQDYIFDIYQTESERKIIEKVYSRKHTILQNQALWALGIVTGDNKRFIAKNKAADLERIITGKEVKKFSFVNLDNGKGKYIKFEPLKFQQTALEKIYRSKEKLIYKFISKDLAFVYDRSGVLTLNSANIVIPQIKSYSVKIIAALFNSTLYQFIYTKKFNSIKVLRGNLEVLPLPLLSKEQKQSILNLVNKLLNSSLSIEKRIKKYDKLDVLIFQIFALNEAEIAIIKENVADSVRLLV